MNPSPASFPTPADPPAPAGDPLWAVVVIHGVGETEPGKTLQAFVPPLVAQTPNLQEVEPPPMRWLPQPEPRLPPRDGPLDPPVPPEPPPRAACFPMHLRRALIREAPPGAPRQAIFAEVFWADLSRTCEGWWSLVVQVFNIIFHFRFVADQAADGLGKAAGCLRLVLYGSGWLLCGPIAAINVFLLYLLAAHFALDKFGDWRQVTITEEGWHLTLVILGLAAVALGAWLVRRSRRSHWGSPWMLVFVWVIAWGALTAGLAATAAWTSTLANLVATLVPLEVGQASPFFAGFVFLVFLLRWTLFLLMTTIVLAVICWLAAVFLNRGLRRTSALTAALGVTLLQIGLWVILVPALALVAFELFYPTMLAPGDAAFTRAPATLALHLLLGLMVFALAIWIWLARARWVRRHPAPYRDVEQAQGISRLLVHGVILAGLIGVSLTGGVLFQIGMLRDWWPVHDWLRPHVGWLTLAALTALPVIGLFFHKGLRAALHIFMDIVSHFYRLRLEPPCPWRTTPLDTERFITQQQIEARLRRVLQELVRVMGNVQKLTVVSHSQGTVVALDVLWLAWTARLLAGIDLRLVTMGSPFTHVYQEYFPYRYPPLFRDDGSFDEAAWGALKTTVGEWINVYRVDDFVGTHIAGDHGEHFPVNQPIAAGGHTDYWGQKEVLELLKPQLPG